MMRLPLYLDYPQLKKNCTYFEGLKWYVATSRSIANILFVCIVT
jgi:hypothetical protein